MYYLYNTMYLVVIFETVWILEKKSYSYILQFFERLFKI